MRYSKKHVNEILDQVIEAVKSKFDYPTIDSQIEMIREEHLLVDRRKSSIPEYRTDILRDFMQLKLSYKDLMKKYHCSMRTVKSLLLECAETDERVYNEIEYRRH